MTVIPLVVSLLIVGVAGGDDRKLVGTLGLRSFAVFFAMLVAFAVATGLIAPGLFEFLQLDPAGTARLRESARIELPPAEALSVRGWLLSLVPVNVIRAAADGALLPVVLFTLLYAFALSRLPDETRAPHVAFFRGMGAVMLLIVRWILLLAPIGIFALALTMGQRLGAAVIGAIGFYMGVMIALHIVGFVLMYAIVAASGKVRLGQFARAVLPGQVVGFGSRSSLASLPALVQGANENLHLPPTVVAFVLPLAVSVFKVTSAIYWIVGALFIGKLYGIPLGAGEIALVGAASVLLSFSTPGIPSGGMLLKLPLYAAIGLPVEGIGILIALDTVPDMFKTSLNVTADMATAVLVTPRSMLTG
jgi:proton glutamate symport protein